MSPQIDVQNEISRIHELHHFGVDFILLSVLALELKFVEKMLNVLLKIAIVARL